jgi:hypothetical protein
VKLNLDSEIETHRGVIQTITLQLAELAKVPRAEKIFKDKFKEGRRQIQGATILLKNAESKVKDINLTLRDENQKIQVFEYEHSQIKKLSPHDLQEPTTEVFDEERDTEKSANSFEEQEERFVTLENKENTENKEKVIPTFGSYTATWNEFIKNEKDIPQLRYDQTVASELWKTNKILLSPLSVVSPQHYELYFKKYISMPGRFMKGQEKVLIEKTEKKFEEFKKKQEQERIKV